MGIETLLTTRNVFTAVSAVSSVVGGFQQQREAERQADIEQEQAEAEARVETRENIAFEKRQKLAFLKSGVALAGSPLAVLAETRRRGGENVTAILETGQERARQTRATGRQALLSGFGTGAATAAKGVGNLPESNTKPRVPIPGRKPR